MFTCTIYFYKNGKITWKKNWEINTGFSPAPTFSFGRGFTDDFDAGMILEQQLFTQLALWTKYAFINSGDNGVSLAGYGGVFQAFDFGSSKGFFIGPIVSYKKDWFETYFITRYNYVTWNLGAITPDDRDDVFINQIDWASGSFTYLQGTLGVNFWFSEGFGLNINAQYFKFLELEAETDEIIPGIELMWRF